MTVIGVMTIGPAAPADFGITFAGAAVAKQLGLFSGSRRKKKSSTAKTVSLPECRTVYVEASPQGGAIRSIFGLNTPDRGTGFQHFASEVVDPSVNGSLDWRRSAELLPGGTPFIDCPADPSKAAVLLSNSGPSAIKRLAASGDLAVVDFGEPYMGSPALPCLEYASMVLVVTTPSRPVMNRAANHISSLLADPLTKGRVAVVIRGDAGNEKPDGSALSGLLPCPVSLVVPYDPKAAIGTVKKEKTRETSPAVRTIRSYTNELLDGNKSLGGQRANVSV